MVLSFIIYREGNSSARFHPNNSRRVRLDHLVVPGVGDMLCFTDYNDMHKMTATVESVSHVFYPSEKERVGSVVVYAHTLATEEELRDFLQLYGSPLLPEEP